MLVVNLLEEFGSSLRSRGAERLIFDRQARARLRRHFGAREGLRSIERWLKVYAIVGDDGRVVTVAHQYRRFMRP